MKDLTKEQIEDVQGREKKALEYLKELQLTPAAVMSKANVGNDMFVDTVLPYLQDTKYSNKNPKSAVVSPIQDVKPI